MIPYLIKTKRIFYANECFIKIKHLNKHNRYKYLRQGLSLEDTVLILDYTIQTRSSIKRQIKKDINENLNN